MAELRKIVRSNPISNFQQVAPGPSAAMSVLSQVMETGYQMMLPAAKAEMTELGQQTGYEMARANIGKEPSTGSVATVGTKGEPDNFNWKKYARGGATRPDGISGLKPEMRSSLAQMFQVADQELGEGLQVSSGYRSPDRQAQIIAERMSKYGLGGRTAEWNADVSKMGPVAAGEKWRSTFRAAGLTKWVGMPGKSRHQHGDAADLSFNGQRLDQNPKVAAWVRQNAARFGLHVPMAHEPWEVRGQSALGGQSVRASTKDTPKGEVRMEPEIEPPQTTITTAEGKTERRLFSPLSGPLLQIHNAAANAAYLAETENQSIAAMMDLGRQFEGDPKGFQQAADEYVASAVKAAPSMFRGDVQQKLRQIAQRRLLGMHEEQQRDIRQRASNSNAALIDRYGDEYSQALASGDEAEAARARGELESALRLRETLPGLAWTPEQSFNAIRKAQQQAERVRNTAQRESDALAKKTLGDIIRARKDGLSHADEGILSDPSIQERNPELWREAAAWVMLTDSQPEILQMTPAELAAAVEQARAEPIKSDFQRDILKAMEGMAKEQRKGFEDDPIKRAQQVLPWFDTQIDLSDPAKFASSMMWRHEQARRLAGLMPDDSQTGPRYTDRITLLSEDEAKQVGTILSKDTPPELRLAYASAALQGLDQAGATAFFRQVGGGDPVLKMSALYKAGGGDEATAVQALRGQAMLDEGLVMSPTKAATLAQIDEDITAAIAHIPEKDQGDLLKFVKALYASDARGIDHTSDDAKAKMAEALQTALGRKVNARGQEAGGVQKIGGPQGRGGYPTLLPMNVTADQANAALRRGFGIMEQSSLQQIVGGVLDTAFSATGIVQNPIPMQRFNRETGEFEDLALPERQRMPSEALFGGATDTSPFWQSAGAASAPMLGGKPLDPKWVDEGFVSITADPYARGFYLMQLRIPGGEVTDLRDSQGRAFTFNLEQLIEATR